MVVEIIPNRPVEYEPIYRLTLAPYDLIGGGPPDFEKAYLTKYSEKTGRMEKIWISEIYIHPKQVRNFKETVFFGRLEPFLEPNYKIHLLYST